MLCPCPLLRFPGTGRDCNSKSRAPILCGYQGVKMEASSIRSFTKTPSCPSSAVLLSFRSKTLAPEFTALLQHHLSICEFCRAEIALLANYRPPVKGETKAPDLPINLRILAESIIGRTARTRNPPGKDGSRNGART